MQREIKSLYRQSTAPPLIDIPEPHVYFGPGNPVTRLQRHHLALMKVANTWPDVQSAQNLMFGNIL